MSGDFNEMKRVLAAVLCAVMLLSLTACGKTENISADLPAERSVLIAESVPQVVQSAPESTESSAPEDTKTYEIPKLGELVGPEDFPSRGVAACIVTKSTFYVQNEKYNNSETEVFDEHGNSLYRTRSYGDPKISSYEYDERGNVIREYYETNYYCDNEYDENGRLVSYKAFKNGEPAFAGTEIYDEHGELSELRTDYYFNGEFLEQTVHYYEYIFDESGRKIALTEYHTDHNEIWEETAYEYDGDILKRRVCTDPNGDGKTVWEYIYDADGNIVNYKITFYEQDDTVKSTYREERSYNADGKIVQTLCYNNDGELDIKELYEYKYAD